jgi:hypothetical protein
MEAIAPGMGAVIIAEKAEPRDRRHASATSWAETPASPPVIVVMARMDSACVEPILPMRPIRFHGLGSRLR